MERLGGRDWKAVDFTGVHGLLVSRATDMGRAQR